MSRICLQSNFFGLRLWICGRCGWDEQWVGRRQQHDGETRLPPGQREAPAVAGDEPVRGRRRGRRRRGPGGGDLGGGGEQGGGSARPWHLGRQTRLHPVRGGPRHRPGQRVALSLPLLQERGRRLPHPLLPHSLPGGNTHVLHGVGAGTDAHHRRPRGLPHRAHLQRCVNLHELRN